MKTNVNFIQSKVNTTSTEIDQAFTTKNNSFFEMIIEGLSKLDETKWEHYLKDTIDVIPKNAFTKQKYTRFNRLILYIDLLVNQFETPFYATFNQISKAGGILSKGAKSVLIQYFNFDVKHKKLNKRISMTEYRLLNDNEKEFYIVRSYLKNYRVFNISLISNLDSIDLDAKNIDLSDDMLSFEDLPSAEKLIEDLVGYRELRLKFSLRDTASYSPSLDEINMPHKQYFKDDIKYYSTLFHELIHWTGNPIRLHRFEIGDKPTTDVYAFEELVAEMGAMLLYFDFELKGEFINSLVYLKNWVKHTTNNENRIEVLSTAFYESKRAVNYIYK